MCSKISHSKDAPEIDAALFQPAVKVQQSTTKPKMEVVTSDESNDKRLKQLRKKLDQVTKLKEKQENGESLEQNQARIHCFICVLYTCHSVLCSWQSWQLNKTF